MANPRCKDCKQCFAKKGSQFCRRCGELRMLKVQHKSDNRQISKLNSEIGNIQVRMDSYKGEVKSLRKDLAGTSRYKFSLLTQYWEDLTWDAAKAKADWADIQRLHWKIKDMVEGRVVSRSRRDLD